MYGSNDMNVKGILISLAILAAAALVGVGFLIRWWFS